MESEFMGTFIQSRTRKRKEETEFNNNVEKTFCFSLHFVTFLSGSKLCEMEHCNLNGKILTPNIDRII